MNIDGFTDAEFTCGLADKEHQKNMGRAVWTYLWLWARKEKSIRTSGYVNGGKRIRLADIARDLGLSERTVSRHLARLHDGDYLDVEFEGRGISAVIWFWIPDKTGGADTKATQPRQNCHT